MEKANPGNEKTRLLAIDGLRGVAAMAVVLFHLSGNLAQDLPSVLPSWIITIFQYGFIGVPIFFVLSGFVISASVKTSGVNLGYLGRFALRRSLRLDPAYWCAILLAIVMLVVKETILGYSVDYPSAKDVFIHALYLQDIFSLDYQLSSVFWTLCLEIQFYLFYVFSLYLICRFKIGIVLDLHSWLMIVFCVVSVLIYSNILNIYVSGWFVLYWHFFVLGCFAQRAIQHGGVHKLLFFVFLVFDASSLLVRAILPYVAAALTSTAFIFWQGMVGQLKAALNYGWLQFLGKISYSLYLLHPEVGWKTISILQSVQKFKSLPYSPVIALLAGVLASVISAYIFYRIVEKPSMDLSKKIT